MARNLGNSNRSFGSIVFVVEELMSAEIILSKNWAGEICVLVFETGKLVKLDQRIKFQGKYHTVDGGRAPQHRRSTGHVWLKRNEIIREYYPITINALWLPQSSWESEKKTNPDPVPTVEEVMASFGFIRYPGKPGHWVEPYSKLTVRNRTVLRWAKESPDLKKRIKDEIGKLLDK
jgi:hypothetical protein